MSPPLSGRTIVVTRARLQASSLSPRLTQLGATVVEEPLIELTPPPDWTDVDEAIDNIERYDHIIFASANAVRFFCQRWKEKRDKLEQLKELAIAAIGSATAKELQSFQLKANYQPSKFVADKFIEEFTAAVHVSGKRILWPKTNIGRTLIQDALTDAGAQVDAIVCYLTDAPNDLLGAGQRLATHIKNQDVDAITLASAQTVRNFKKALEPASHNIANSVDAICLACIGPETTKAALELFPNSKVISASEYTTEGIARALVEQLGSPRND